MARREKAGMATGPAQRVRRCGGRPNSFRRPPLYNSADQWLLPFARAVSCAMWLRRLVPEFL
jgi:hypothetical protein